MGTARWLTGAAVLAALPAVVVIGGGGAGSSCVPALWASGIPNEDARASSPDGLEAWALFTPMGPVEVGEPVVVRLDDADSDLATKIVWRVAGDGELTLSATGPGGQVIAPSELNEHRWGSGWDRPGDEWGSGWHLPTPGCWTFQLQRGSSQATLTVVFLAPADDSTRA